MSERLERRKPHTFDGLDDVFPQPADPRVSRDDFGRALAVLMAAFPGRPLQPATGELYYRALSHYERADLLAGVRDAVVACEQWPAIAALRRLCDDARARRREREGVSNVPGQEVTPERAARIAALHEAEAALRAARAEGDQPVIDAAVDAYRRAVAALTE